MDFITLAEVTVDGLARGMLFAMLGAGITLVFGLGNVLNLALGVFSVIAVIVAAQVTDAVPHVAIAVLIAIGAVGLLGLAIDRIILSSVYRSTGEERILLGIFTTLGLAIFLDGLLFVYYPGNYSVSHGVSSISVGAVGIRGSTLLIIGSSFVILLALFVFLRLTFLGKVSRTVFQDETGAILCGINPRRIRTLIFVLSIVIAGAAGVMWSLQSAVSPASAFELTIFAIIVSIVGGVRNIEGTIVAGLLLGFVITYANYFIGTYQAMIILFGVAVAVLILRPEEIA